MKLALLLLCSKLTATIVYDLWPGFEGVSVASERKGDCLEGTESVCEFRIGLRDCVAMRSIENGGAVWENAGADLCVG